MSPQYLRRYSFIDVEVEDEAVFEGCEDDEDDEEEDCRSLLAVFDLSAFASELERRFHGRYE
jgi:hypothetical protein